MAPSGGQICNKCKRCHVVAKFNPSHGVNFWVRCASGNVSEEWVYLLPCKSLNWLPYPLRHFCTLIIHHSPICNWIAQLCNSVFGDLAIFYLQTCKKHKTSPVLSQSLWIQRPVWISWLMSIFLKIYIFSEIWWQCSFCKIWWWWGTRMMIGLLLVTALCALVRSGSITNSCNILRFTNFSIFFWWWARFTMMMLCKLCRKTSLDADGNFCWKFFRSPNGTPIFFIWYVSLLLQILLKRLGGLRLLTEKIMTMRMRTEFIETFIVEAKLVFVQYHHFYKSPTKFANMARYQ